MTIRGSNARAAHFEEVLNPATGAAFARAPVANLEQLDEAVEAARGAFAQWSSTTLTDRQAKVREFATVLRENLDDLARTLTSEQGKSISDATMEMHAAIAFMESYCDLSIDTEVLRSTSEEHVEVRRRPVGVVAAITPWNFPVMMALWKIGPALVAGNTIVLKPAPTTPLTTLKIGELGQQVFPKGVLNIINGDGEVGSALVKHPDISKIAFTGSTATGKHIMNTASTTLKRLTLELGGNDAGIVLPDIDVETVAKDIFWAKFSNAGQICAALKRLFVHDDIYDELVAQLVQIAKSVKMGDGFADGVLMGPVQNAMQRDKLRSMVDDAKAKGAKVVYQGDIPEGDGFWFPITILADVPADASAVTDEAFGPLLTIHRFSDPEDALTRANASPYGLGASVWSGDVDAAVALAERMDSGTAWVNQHPAMGPDTPFGGVKSSGMGVEGARWGLMQYTNIHVVNVKKN